MDKYLVLFTFIGALVALIYAIFTARKVLNFSEGTEQMKKISRSIREGANAYLKRQYVVVAVFFAVMFVILTVMAIAGFLTFFVPFALAALRISAHSLGSGETGFSRRRS